MLDVRHDGVRVGIETHWSVHPNFRDRAPALERTWRPQADDSPPRSCNSSPTGGRPTRAASRLDLRGRYGRGEVLPVQ